MKENQSYIVTNADVKKYQIIHAAKQTLTATALLAIMCSPALASNGTANGTGGGDFEEVYNFIFDAATGYLGRAIAIFAGVVGLAIGAASGKAMPAIMGVILAIFGTLGPTIINGLFTGAVI